MSQQRVYLPRLPALLLLTLALCLAPALGNADDARSYGTAGSDPAAMGYDHMSEDDLAERYSLQDPPPSATALLSRLTTAPPLSSLVDVVLVGFAGDGDANVVVEGGELARYLQAAGMTKEQARYTVTEAPRSLRERLQRALQSAVDQAVEQNPHLVRPPHDGTDADEHSPGHAIDPTVPISVSVVHQLLADDYADSVRSTVIYLLNLAPVWLRESASPAAADRVRLRYVYTQTESSSSSSSDSATGCPTTHWVSSASSGARFAWFDLSAGPISYGPHTWGQGLVSEFALPNARRMRETQTRYERAAWMLAEAPLVGGVTQASEAKGEFKPSKKLNTHFHHQLLSEMALLLQKVTQGLLSPPAAFWPVTAAPALPAAPTASGTASAPSTSSAGSNGTAAPPASLRIVLTFVHERHYLPPTVATREEQAREEALRKEEEQRGHAGLMSKVKELLKKKKGMHIASSRHGEGDKEGKTDETEHDRTERAAWELYPDDDAASDSASWAEWSALESILSSLALPGQVVTVDNTHLRFEECPGCVAAFTHALRTHTSSVGSGESSSSDDSGSFADPTVHRMRDGDGDDLGQVRTQVRPYLDAQELKDWLEHFDVDRINDADDDKETSGVGAGAGKTAPGELKRQRATMDLNADIAAETAAKAQHERVLRVFVFDLASRDLILLDRFHQSLAFPQDGLVLSVQTRAAPAPVDFQCDGRGVRFDPRSATRATLGAVLTAAWGVSPTHQRWVAPRHDTEHDYMFSTGHTPYGFFSRSQELSFAIRDAAMRHVLLSELHSAMQELASAVPTLALQAASDSASSSSFAGHSAARSSPFPPSLMDSLLLSSSTLDFVRRANVLLHLQSRALHWINLHQFGAAWKYVRAYATDAQRMGELIRQQVGTVEATMQCGAVEETADEEDGLNSLPLASPSAPSSRSSATALPSTVTWLFFASLEVSLLACVVVAVFLVTRYPYLVASYLPRSVARGLGMGPRKPHYM